MSSTVLIADLKRNYGLLEEYEVCCADASMFHSINERRISEVPPTDILFVCQFQPRLRRSATLLLPACLPVSLSVSALSTTWILARGSGAQGLSGLCTFAKR